MELFLDVLGESLVDTAKMLPFLFLAYLLIEYIEHRNGERIANESANNDAIPFAAASHPGGVWCQVFDVNAPADVQIF